MPRVKQSLENSKEYKTRDEIFSAIEEGDFSLVERKYADPHYGSEEAMDFVEEMAYVLEKVGGKTKRCDIDGDGFDELLILRQYNDEVFERIDFILDYRNGSAVCLYYDWCDGGFWWWKGQEPEITQTGMYYTRCGKELITKEQFLQEYKELTGAEFALDY